MPKTITFTDRELETLREMAGDAAEYRDPYDGYDCRDCDEVREPGRFDAVNARCSDHASDREKAWSYAELAAKVAGDKAH
ncbi:hypothetical protein [Kocuria rosea]|uniref:hypothetical protein n=1 Tax=Kocuria rosea TaxID=1275 RepID=UPI002541BD6A|nr:hypothetical protein [Kocuria rosea]WIG18380.1 hypothetical protein QOY29_05480 [Kocuria rosea]